VPARSGLVTGVTVGRSQAVGGVDHVRDLRGALSINRRWGGVAVMSATAIHSHVTTIHAGTSVTTGSCGLPKAIREI
jgi:hypothetical protein